MRAAWKILLVVGLGSLVGVGGGISVHRVWPRSPVVEGLTIGERRVPDRGDTVKEWLARRREVLRSRTVRLRSGAQVFEVTLGASGVSIDDAETLARAREIGHRGSVWTRLREAERARRGEIDVPLAWTIDPAKARALLATIAPSVARDPVDARLDLTNHTKIPDEPGHALDVEATIERLARASHEDEETIDLALRPTPAKVTVEDLTRVDIEKVVSAYETTFSLIGTGAMRAANIRNAAARIDGIVLGSGEVFSFNGRVGPRTRERGFVLAPEIQGDELQLGYGGGTCQVSSTLYAAALFGAIDVFERQSHSRPSSYTKMGLDATVSYPLADLKFKNTLPYPIMIHAYLPKPTAVRVEILGGAPVAKVEYAYGVSATEDFLRRVTVKPSLRPGTRMLHQKGVRGFDVTSVVKVNYLDGRTLEKRYFSGYRPAPEIYWVAPGYDTSELPPLPEHAKGVEGVPSDQASGEPPTSGFVGG